MKMTAFMLAALAITTIGSSFIADTAEARKFNASRNRVEAACDQYGEVAFGTRGRGQYGCAGDNGWIFCEANGRCEGGRTASRTTRKRPSAKLPLARR